MKSSLRCILRLKMNFKEFMMLEKANSEKINSILNTLNKHNIKDYKVKDNKISVFIKDSERINLLQKIADIFKNENAFYNPHGAGSGIGRVELTSDARNKYYIFAKPSGRSGGARINLGLKFERDFAEALQNFVNSEDYNFKDGIDDILKICQKENYVLAEIIPEGVLNKKRPFTFSSNGIFCGGDDFNIGHIISDITLRFKNIFTQNTYDVYLSLKSGETVTFCNIGTKKFLFQDEIERGRIENKNALQLLEMLAIDPVKFCNVFNNYKKEKNKKEIIDITSILQKSILFKNFMKSVIGYGYIFVHNSKGKIHVKEMTEISLENILNVKNAEIIYPYGSAKRVDIKIELNGLLVKLNLRSKDGGVYPGFFQADYRFL